MIWLLIVSILILTFLPSVLKKITDYEIATVFEGVFLIILIILMATLIIVAKGLVVYYVLNVMFSIALSYGNAILLGFLSMVFTKK
ncbi:MAG: hypothetical protein ACOCP4_04280 [Candidatus Woesearchaeota archaeon]